MKAVLLSGNLVSVAMIVCVLAFCQSRVKGAVLEVGMGKPFSTINDAIGSASNGDTIRIGDGVYSEDLILSKQLRLEAENVGGAIVDGGNRGTEFIIDVRADSDSFGLHIRNGNAAVNQHNTISVSTTPAHGA
jgi:nitrous oxidase accessory protein NosD